MSVLLSDENSNKALESLIAKYINLSFYERGKSKEIMDVLSELDIRKYPEKTPYRKYLATFLNNYADCNPKNDTLDKSGAIYDSYKAVFSSKHNLEEREHFIRGNLEDIKNSS